MDLLSVVGVVVAFAAILGGNFLEGGHMSTLLNGPAALIVIGGTFGAAALQTPQPIFVRALKMFKLVFKTPQHQLKKSSIKSLCGQILLGVKGCSA